MHRSEREGSPAEWSKPEEVEGRTAGWELGAAADATETGSSAESSRPEFDVLNIGIKGKSLARLFKREKKEVQRVFVIKHARSTAYPYSKKKKKPKNFVHTSHHTKNN